MWILFLILMTNLASADVFVITAPDQSVYSVSEQDDAITPQGYKKDVIKNQHIKDLPLADNEKMYDFNGNKFTLNAKKVQDKNKAEQDAILAEQDKQTKKSSAIAKFKSMGLSDEEISALIK